MRNNKCYVYVLMDESISMEWEYGDKKYLYKPFYIGIGSGYRINYHGGKADLKSTKNDFKKNYILEIYNNSEIILRTKIIDNISSEEAAKIEIELIKKFGRIINKSGILTNISKGGEKYTYGKDNPRSKKVYQYSIEGLFIKEYECISDIKLEGYTNIKSGISNCSNKNYINFPKKVHKAYNYIWLKVYKGKDISNILKENDNRIYKYSETFQLLNIYESGKDAEKDGYSDSSVYHAIFNNKLYKNCYWAKGKIDHTEKYRNNNDNCKKVYQYSMEGLFMKEHQCIKYIPINEKIDISSCTISDSCSLNEKNYPNKIYTAAGYIWTYDHKGEKLNLNKPKIYQWDSKFNLIKIFEEYDILRNSEFKKQGIEKSIKNKKQYKNYFWTYDNNIREEISHNIYFKKYYQIALNGDIIKVYNKRSEIPEEFNKQNVGSACNKGSKYKGYYWKNKL